MFEQLFEMTAHPSLVGIQTGTLVDMNLGNFYYSIAFYLLQLFNFLLPISNILETKYTNSYGFLGAVTIINAK